ncbi:MAG: hypothetical protein IKG67_03545 [Parasporobacterium sp.]|nr:hypothetical protein [Parasporobacterium sp.]
MNNQNERGYTGKKKNPDSHRKVSAFNAVIFFGLIIIADIFLLFSHSKPFSENENRMLQQAPALTGTSLTSGKFMKQFENFTADQFFYRDGWIYSKLKMDKLLGRKMSNGVYLGGQGYLIEDTAVPNDSSVERNISAINHFSVSHPTIRKVMTIVPNSSEVNQSLVPAGAPIRDQSEDIRQIRDSLGIDIQFVDLIDTLISHNSEQLYYKSDHHWTSLGAKYAFETIAEALQINPDRQFTAMTVADDFSGTMAATSGDFGASDTVEIYVADPEVKYYVEYSGDPVKYSSIYASSALEQKNKYEVFFGGNYPKITITALNDTGRNLLILKDSYANCFIQFLLPYFDRIVIVDPRYYSDDLEEEITSSEITDLLLLYNENTFVEDNSLAGVLDQEA